MSTKKKKLYINFHYHHIFFFFFSINNVRFNKNHLIYFKKLYEMKKILIHKDLITYLFIYFNHDLMISFFFVCVYLVKDLILFNDN